MTPHPFAPATSTVYGANFPTQLLPAKEKDAKWGEQCMDAGEAIGRIQWAANQRLSENYRMLNGEFISQHYLDSVENPYVDLLNVVKEEFKVPTRLRHFDFMRQVVNSLTGELETHPDVFKAFARGEEVNNVRENEKAMLLKQQVMQTITESVNRYLAGIGVDVNQTEFDSEEEQQAHQQQVSEVQQAMSPEDINRYMDYKWQHVSEKWANIQLADDKERYRLGEKESIEFWDMLVTDRCFRHFYLTGTGFQQETWNPMNTFFHMSPDVTETEKGNYIGRIFELSLSDVIDRYGYLMSGEDIEDLSGTGSSTKNKAGMPKDWLGNIIEYTDINGNPYGKRVPTNNPYMFSLPQVRDFTGQSTMAPLDNLLFNSRQSMVPQLMNGYFIVTEMYWKSQQEVGLLYWVNPATGLEEKIIVDESVVIPDYITRTKATVANAKDPQELNTIRLTWINQIYQGIKISPMGNHSYQCGPKYLNIKPVDFQGKADGSMTSRELPVVGSIFNNRNAPSQSSMDLMKPYAIAYNLFLNQAYMIAEEEILPFLAIDPSMIPDLKDWRDGENEMNGFVKWLESVRSMRMGVMETRPQVTKGANAGGQFPTVIDMNTTDRMLHRFQLALSVKQLALEQMGFTPQRLGDVKASESATGVDTATSRSYVQTSTIFSKFYGYKRRCLQKSIDYNQYVQSRGKDSTVIATKSDLSQQFLKINQTDLLASDLHVYVSSTQEAIRKMEMLRQLGSQNNTLLTKMSDRAIMVTSDSYEQIIELIKISEKETEENNKAEFQQKQQQLDQQIQLQREQQQFDAEQNQLDRENKLQEAWIRSSTGRNNSNTTDEDSNGVPDALEYAKLSQQASTDAGKQNVAERKLEQDRTKLLVNTQQHQDKVVLAREKMALDEKLQKQKIQQARIQGDKSK